MKTIPLLLLSVLFAVGLKAEEIHIPHGHLELHVYGDAKVPYCVAGKEFKDVREAAALLRYIYTHWAQGGRPVLITASHSKAALPDEKILWEAVKEVSIKWKVRVIHMPHPRGAIPDAWIESSRLSEEWEKKRNRD